MAVDAPPIRSTIGLVLGYVISGLIIAAGGVIELIFGIKAEGQSMETVTKPLTSVEDDAPRPVAGGADA